MPKKTRKDKIRARARRTANAVPIRHSEHTSVESKQNSLSYQFTAGTARQSPSVPSEDAAELVQIRRDIVRTLILAAIAIGGEIALYFFVRNS